MAHAVDVAVSAAVAVAAAAVAVVVDGSRRGRLGSLLTV